MFRLRPVPDLLERPPEILPPVWAGQYRPSVADAFTIYRAYARVQAVTDSGGQTSREHDRPVKEQLEVAVRDLWTMLEESGDDFAIFMDRRRLRTRVQRDAAGLFHVSWDDGDGQWVEYARTFENVREAAFHAYQGPHSA